MLIAVPRSRPTGNSCATSASDSANMIAPPMPCTARAPIRKLALGASAHASEAAENSSRPARNERLRPSRSASDPAVSTTVASASEYTSITHCRSVKLAPRLCSSFGSAVFTTVMSSSSMNVAMTTAERVHHLRFVDGVAVIDGLRSCG